MVAMVVVVWAGDRSDFVGATASRRIAIAEDARRGFHSYLHSYTNGRSSLNVTDMARNSFLFDRFGDKFITRTILWPN